CEIPDQIATEDAMHCGRAITLDQQPAFLRSGGKRRARFGWSRPDPAMMHDVETHLTGGTDYQLTAHRHGYRRRRPGRFPSAEAQQHDRRPAGIKWRRNPGVDAEIRRHDNSTPIESRGNPF